MSRKTRIGLLVGILIIATFFRFYHFTTVPPGLYPDEAIDGNNAAEALQTGHFQVYYPEDNGREGLYVNLIAGLLKVFPVHEAWIVRLPAAIAGVLTVLGLYLLVTELFSAEVALLAAFFLATSFWHIIFSRIGFRAILAPLLLTWTLYLLIKAFRSGSSRIRGYTYAALAGIIYALGFYTYIAYRVTPLLLLLFIPFFKRIPDFWKRAGVFVILTVIVAAPIGLYFLHNPGDFFGRTSQISVTSSGNPLAVLGGNIVKTLLMFNIHGDDNWRHNLSGAPELYWPVGILFLLGIGWSLAAFRRYRFAVLSLFLWFGLAMLPVVLSNEGIPHALRAILMVPPALIFAALGGMFLYRLLEKQKMHPKIIGALFIIVIVGATYLDYFVIWANNPNVAGSFNADYVTIGHAINALPINTPKYIIVQAGGVPIRGLPTPVETTMFITDSFTESNQMAKNIHYLLPDQTNQIPSGTPSSTIFILQ
jgi:4-amino-4-deoxy-L-arabinose transferase-like glycosyltransferase